MLHFHWTVGTWPASVHLCFREQSFPAEFSLQLHIRLIVISSPIGCFCTGKGSSYFFTCLRQAKRSSYLNMSGRSIEKRTESAFGSWVRLLWSLEVLMNHKFLSCSSQFHQVCSVSSLVKPLTSFSLRIFAFKPRGWAWEAQRRILEKAYFSYFSVGLRGADFFSSELCATEKLSQAFALL